MPLPHASIGKSGDGVWKLSKEESLKVAKREIARNRRAQYWSRSGQSGTDDMTGQKLKGGLPICPYGCGREGTLLEIVKQTDGRYLGIFNDHPCSCIFVADIEVGEPPTMHKYEIGADGEMHLVEGT